MDTFPINNLPPEVLLNVLDKVGGERELLDPVMTNLRLVNRHFNSILSNPRNFRRIESTRMRVALITIAQIGKSFVIRVVVKGNEMIHAFPDASFIHLRREGDQINDGWIRLMEIHKDISCEAPQEFFDTLSSVLDKYATDYLHFANILLTRSFLSSLIPILRRHSRIPSIDFEECGSEKGGETEFSKDVDDEMFGELSSHFIALENVPSRFVTSRFMEKFTMDSNSNLELRFIPERGETPHISLRCFSSIYFFKSFRFSTTLSEIIDATEGRIKRGSIKRWSISLSDGEAEIRSFVNKCARVLNYQIGENAEKRRFKLFKLVNLNGEVNEVHVAIQWEERRHRRGFVAEV
ncbi:hypothetical protein PMAYCL1PPCAC_23079, partial [Pristionchus mayeri]